MHRYWIFSPWFHQNTNMGVYVAGVTLTKILTHIHEILLWYITPAKLDQAENMPKALGTEYFYKVSIPDHKKNILQV